MLEWIKQNKATAAFALVVIVILVYGGYQALAQSNMSEKSDKAIDEETGSNTEASGSESRTHKDKAATPVVVVPQYIDLTAPGYGRDAKRKKLERGVKKITLADLTIKTIVG